VVFILGISVYSLFVPDVLQSGDQSNKLNNDSKIVVASDETTNSRLPKQEMVVKDDFRLYLPLVVNQPSGIHGHVSNSGNHASGITLELRLFDGNVFSTVATTTTDQNGRFLFRDIASLESGTYYYVRYRNTASTPGNLWAWSSRTINTYSSGEYIEAGDFDIADIVLLSPNDGVTIELPTRFQWMRRPVTTSDSYEFDVYDPTDYSPWWWTAPLGYTDSYTLSTLTGFNTVIPYAWEVRVLSPDGGFGISFHYRLVTFTGIMSSPKDMPEDFRKRFSGEYRR